MSLSSSESLGCTIYQRIVYGAFFAALTWSLVSGIATACGHPPRAGDSIVEHLHIGASARGSPIPFEDM